MQIWVESRDERFAEWEEIIRKAAHRTLREVGEADAEVSVVLTDDDTIRELNRRWRGQDRPTDVLSFPQREGEAARADDRILGDVVISVPRALEQAERYGHSPQRELGFLTVHGILHLLGWDHQTPEDEARMMATSEAILNGLGWVRETR